MLGDMADEGSFFHHHRILGQRFLPDTPGSRPRPQHIEGVHPHEERQIGIFFNMIRVVQFFLDDDVRNAEQERRVRFRDGSR